MKKLILLLCLLSTPACAQWVDQSALDAKLKDHDAAIGLIMEELDNIYDILDDLQNDTNVTVYPYGNWVNSKYTFPDASERPALEVIGIDSPYIKFHPDGSITYTLPEGLEGTPTTNAKYLRIERREYKDMATKENYTQGDIIWRDNCVVFNKLLLGVADVVFTQVHGTPWVVNGKKSDTPYFKWVAGKDGVRSQFKTKWGLSSDDKVISLLPKSELIEGKEYCYKWWLDGVKFTYDFNGNTGGLTFDRPDDYYPKDGAYGPVGVSLTHKPAKE